MWSNPQLRIWPHLLKKSLMENFIILSSAFFYDKIIFCQSLNFINIMLEIFIIYFLTFFLFIFFNFLFS